MSCIFKHCNQHCILIFLFPFSPNMAFLSQSILARDGSMCARVAHEISHSWFGLLIGAKDWSEEWLSEGFATYMEERIHCKVEGVSLCLYCIYPLLISHTVCIKV